MTLNRMAAKTLFQSIDKYEQFKEMVEEAVKPVSPSLVSTHPQNRVKLDDQFIDETLRPNREVWVKAEW